MISNIASNAPYLLWPTIFFVSGFIGITLLFSPRDQLIDRYQNFLFNVMERTPHHRSNRRRYRKVMLALRLLGLLAVAICGGTGFFVATTMLGQ